jgi:diguanylate cyclase (GGDEF)-like protein
MNDDLLTELQELRTENNRLHHVIEVSAIISESLDLKHVLDTLMEKAKDVLEAEASSLMLLDSATQELYFYTVKGSKDEELKKIRLKPGEGIAGWVASERKPLLVEDCYNDDRFSKKGDSHSGFITRSMMSVPLMAKGKVLGTVQVLNKQDSTFFNNADLKIFQVLAQQASIAIENARLHEKATKDGMTGLYMKGYFLSIMEEEFDKAKQTGESVSLIMSDIDFFKKVNDSYGHQGGDTALIELARIMRETVEDLKGNYIAGRYGGEEFCVLMPGADGNRAIEVGEMIRKRIENESIRIGEADAKITISVGVSSFPFNRESLHTPEDFVKLADEALYVCKHRGRNCVSMYGVQY